MALDCITCAIAAATDDLTAYRLVRLIETGELRMPLELKGLKANMLKLQARVDRLNSIAMKADEKGAMLESHLGDLHGQLGAHVEDIEFAANMLGNGGPHSDEPSGESTEAVQTISARPGEAVAIPASNAPVVTAATPTLRWNDRGEQIQ